jgi:PBP1b-binding outer membrane lipoprotein LpoB
MTHRITLAVIAALAVVLGGCSATYGYRATPPASSLQAQSLRTLDQASQLGSRAE